MIDAAALLALFDELDRGDPIAVRHFNSLALGYLWKQQPVVLSGAGFVTVRLPWSDGPHIHTMTRFPPLHKLPNIRARIRVRALELGERI